MNCTTSDAEVTLWPSKVDNGVQELLLKEFSQLKIAMPGSRELSRAFDECDFLLHGSGASIVAERDLIRWREATGKPYGIYGITFPLDALRHFDPNTEDSERRTLNHRMPA